MEKTLMTNKDWKITFECADYGVHDQVIYASGEQLLEASRDPYFRDLIEGTGIDAALVTYGEAVQDGLA
jgi:hypothetical protein